MARRRELLKQWESQLRQKTSQPETRIRLHSEKQESAVFSDQPVTLCATGIQWGKTLTGSLWLKRRIHHISDEKAAFIVTAPTYKILEQSTMPAFMRVMGECGDLNKAQAIFKVRGGGTVYFRTNTEPDSIVGITDVHAIWCDEAGKYTLYFWENIQGRSSFRKSPIMLTTSPYSMNWIYTEIIKPVREGLRDDVLLVQARSDENPYFPREEYLRKQQSMDPRRFNMMYGGVFDRMEGLVYDCFDEEENVCDPFPLPAGTKYYAGIDWGFTEPFCLTVRAITPEGFHYQVSEFYKSNMTINDIVEVCQQKKKIFNIQTFYCGHDEPASIEELNRNKLTAVAAMQGKGSKRVGIDLHYNLLKTRRLKFFRGCADHTLDEMKSYHYPEPADLGPDDNLKTTLPVEQNDHACDSNRYCTVMTYRVHEVRRAVVPGGDQPRELNNEERIRKLKKGRLNNMQTEKWS